MKVRLKFSFLIVILLFIGSSYDSLAIDPSDVNFHESVVIGACFFWEFTKYEAYDIHVPELSTEYSVGDIIEAEVISSPVFTISAYEIPRPIKEDGWIDYSMNNTIIDITIGVFTAMAVYPYSFLYPVSYRDSTDIEVDYFDEFYDFFQEQYVSVSTYNNEYWQKLGEEYYENKYTRRDEDGTGSVYQKIYKSTGFLSKVEVIRHASDNEYDVHYILESIEYRDVVFSISQFITGIFTIGIIAITLRKKKNKI